MSFNEAAIERQRGVMERDDAMAERFSLDRRPHVMGKYRELNGPYDEEHRCYLLGHDGQVLWDGPIIYADVSQPAHRHYWARLRARETAAERLWARCVTRWNRKHQPPPQPARFNEEEDDTLCTWCGAWFCPCCGHDDVACAETLRDELRLAREANEQLKAELRRMKSDTLGLVEIK